MFPCSSVSIVNFELVNASWELYDEEPCLIKEN